MGNVYHHILEQLVRKLLENRQNWSELQPAVASELIRTYAREIGKNLRGELLLSSARNKYILQRIEKTLTQVVATQQAVAVRGQFRPAFAELGFGINGSQLPPFRVHTPRGREAFLYGKIDRVDLIQDQAECAVIDYKLTGRALELDKVYYGISLQLLTYLLVLQANGQPLVGHPLTPVAAFYTGLLRKLEDTKRPQDALPPDDPTFNLKVKPRGIFDARCIAHFDNELQRGSASKVVNVYVKQDGNIGNRDRSDAAHSHEFSALLKHVESQLGQLSDRILSGSIDVQPYWINRDTPCPTCQYHAVCRFDTIHNRYNILPAMKRDEVFKRLTGESDDDQ